ncbi:hypothetical protein ACFSCX_24590 [Bacillus salitolerans]|uniref:Uncharacterized protein n=1 Tax=Bacillus salitolerans TaxID=1437434 RepID=A0ABW4LX93_9BACI
MFWTLFILTIVICLPGIFFMVQTEKKLEDAGDISDKEQLSHTF